MIFYHLNFSEVSFSFPLKWIHIHTAFTVKKKVVIVVIEV
jgi:hypothetical protein